MKRANWVSFFDTSVLAEDAIKAALADYKLKQDNKKKWEEANGKTRDESEEFKIFHKKKLCASH